MCCCQLASAVAHLLPALTSSCLCFVAPKQGPDSGPKNGATILKLAAQLPNVWSQFWAHGVCVLPSAKSALSCDRLHLPFMFSCAWCQDAGFTCRVHSEGCAKSMSGLQSAVMVHASLPKPLERFKRGRDACLCSAANMTATSNAKTCVPPAAVSGPKNGRHNTKISSPASKCVVPILGSPWCMRFAFSRKER